MTNRQVFRFAPSPNGELHLGHVLSACLNRQMADRSGGVMLLRMEDIDQARCTPAFERQITEDLRWLGIGWDGPVRRQSEYFDAYRSALRKLDDMGLVYPASMSRREIREHVDTVEARGGLWPRDPDGQPHYPGLERDASKAERDALTQSGRPYTLRLDMAQAVESAGGGLTWNELGSGPDGARGVLQADPASWGDVILARSDTPTSYHLSVVMDDAAQDITDVVRGQDLFHATAVHRLLQRLLDLPEPRYHHHELLLGPDGKKLSKTHRDRSIRAMREAGLSPHDVLDAIEDAPRSGGVETASVHFQE